MLWLIGMSQSSIAAVLLKRRKQVAGIVDRSPYAKRSEMTDAERQAAINELLAVRLGEDGKTVDGGILDRVPMKIIPLRRAQRRKGSS
ncbi:hypothetical protein [Ancylobacter sp. 3268]|uniref:hypothetical protein n=1 Tax=Ancylobacter sp. 3268 TaxID=2817752 RepID=UPI00286B2564|nr:hypothetical protein [Ancylobacter sp. 3268]